MLNPPRVNADTAFDQVRDSNHLPIPITTLDRTLMMILKDKMMKFLEIFTLTIAAVAIIMIIILTLHYLMMWWRKICQQGGLDTSSQHLDGGDDDISEGIVVALFMNHEQDTDQVSSHVAGAQPEVQHGGDDEELSEVIGVAFFQSHERKNMDQVSNHVAGAQPDPDQ